MRWIAFFIRFGLICVYLACGITAGRTQSGKPSTDTRPATLDRRYAVSKGAWSGATVSLFNTWTAFHDTPGRHIAIWSPDHEKQILVIGKEVRLRINGRTFDTGINGDLNLDAELGWSPDSTKYFVTWTESGELGPWHMQVFGVDDSGVHEFPKVAEPARLDFERRVRAMPIDPEMNTPDRKPFWDMAEYCEPYHVIGGRWLNGSSEILLSVLIRNTGDCRYMSDFNVYRVNAKTGQIIGRFTASEGHRRFGNRDLPKISP
jgi:hypothetical protein